MKKGIIILFMLCIPSFALSATLTVPVPYSSIQSAINAANDYDEVWVDPGTYVENIDFIGKAIIVKSTGGNAVTVIDGGMPSHPDYRSVVVFKSGEGPDSVLDGFTITNGTGSRESGTTFDLCGGGIYCWTSHPTIINNIIEYNNLATANNAGGGVFLDTSLATIQNNIIRDNQNVGGGTSPGGGICCYYSSPIISENVISNNYINSNGSHGGGIACLYSFAGIYDNSFIGNEVAGTYQKGGGLYCSNCDPSVTNNLFESNKALGGYGGGIYCTGVTSATEIHFNTFKFNEAGCGGGYSGDSGPGPDIYQNMFEENKATYGGAIYGLGAKIWENTIRYNTATTSGGGIYTGAEIIDNIIYKNSAVTGGGGILTSVVGTIKNNLIEGNDADNGAGIYCPNGSTTALIIKSNKIINNTATIYGGGLYAYYSSPTIDGNMIKDNLAATNGGGIYIDLDYTSDFPIVNNIILGNWAGSYGGGMYFENADPDILHNTLYGNKVNVNGGGGLCFNSSSKEPLVANCILWDNSAPSTKGPEIWVGGGSEVVIKYCDVKGGKASTYTEPGSLLFWQSGMIDLDPRFVVETTGDLHIRYDSPCREAGDSGLAMLPTLDYDGDPRHVYLDVDMGADEFSTHLYYAGDSVPGGFISINFVDTPNIAPVIMWLGSGIMDPPLYHKKYGFWYLQFPLLVELDMGSIPYPGGVLELPVFIPNGTPAPLDLPIQALIGNKLSNLTVIEIR